MSEQRLKDLLNASVDDLVAAPLAEGAWEAAVRRRRSRRVAGAVAVAIAVATIAVSTAVLSGGDSGRDGAPVTTPSSPAPSPDASDSLVPPADSRKPDGRKAGWRVYWGPSSDQEQTLPWVGSPLPRQIDLAGSSTPLVDDPIQSALAAWAISDEAGLRRVVVLAADGSLRSVDVGRVQPLADEGGNEIATGTAMLSPRGTHLQFPQDGHVLVLALATGQWRDIDTGQAITEHAQWIGDDIHLPPTAAGGAGPLYSVDGRRAGSANQGAPTAPPGAGAAPYGITRAGPPGDARSWSGVPDLPVPEDEVTPSQVLVVDGFDDADRAVLLFGHPGADGSTPRAKNCCPVAFWLDDQHVVYEVGDVTTRLIAWRVGTHEFARVGEVTGSPTGEEFAVASYARIWS